MEIDPQSLDTRDRYRLMIGCLLPRPIAWISTLGSNGIANLAPYSFFAGVTSTPPTVMLSVGRRKGQRKDTSQNLLATGEGVIHIPHRPLAEPMVTSSADVVPEVDEFELTKLATAPAVRVKPPRVAAAAIAMECTVAQHLEIGAAPMDVFFLNVVYLHLADEYLQGNLPDPAKLAAVGRLGGDEYCDTHEVFTIRRPKA